MSTTITWHSGIMAPKDPDAEVDFQFDFTDWLNGDTIATIDVDGGGLTVGTNSTDGSVVTFWLSGGTAGTSYTVRVRITTAAGRIDDRSLIVQVAER